MSLDEVQTLLNSLGIEIFRGLRNSLDVNERYVSLSALDSDSNL